MSDQDIRDEGNRMVRIINSQVEEMFNVMQDNARRFADDNKEDEAAAVAASLGLAVSSLVRIVMHDYPDLNDEVQEMYLGAAVHRGIHQAKKGIRIQ